MRFDIFRCSGEGLPLFQYLATLSGTLNLVCSGMHYGWASPSLPQLLHNSSHITITNDEGSWIAVMVLLGSICGAIGSGYLLNVFGRKNVVLLLSSLPFFVSWMMIAFASSVPVLLVARFLAGVGDGIAFCSVPPYISEISEAGVRGLLVSASSVAYTLGILTINVVGSYLSIRTTALISSTLPIMLLLTFSWMPESPYFYLMKGRIEEARASLQIFKGRKDVDEELNRLDKAVAEETQHSGKFLDLFTDKTNRKALLIMMGIRAAQQFSGYSAFLFYAQIIFQQSGELVSPVASSSIYFGVSLVMSIISSAIIDRTGRRPLLIISTIGTTLALLTEGLYFYVENQTDLDVTNFRMVPIVALVLFVVMYAVGLQAMPFVLVGELFSTNVRAFAVSFQDIYFSLFATAASKFFQITKDEFGMHVPFFVFAICCTFGLAFVVFFVPETKGKTLEEIQREMRRGRSE